MRSTRALRPLSMIPVLALAGAAVVSCSQSSTGLGAVTQGCQELESNPDAIASAQVDVRVRAFMKASADLRAVGAKLKVSVRDACIAIASDLGAPDTWSSLGEDDRISNACDAARTRIESIMKANASANFALIVSRGACHQDFKALADCEVGCSQKTKCDPGKVETRCTPGDLSVKCDTTCKAQASCEGRVDVEANCAGKCEAECHGSCMGTCIGEAGVVTSPGGGPTAVGVDCIGKCAGTCTGKCNGHCKIEVSEGISCGASVRCKGGCTSTYTEPTCESDFTPPSCTVDTGCFESCRATAAASAVCDPPFVKLLASGNLSADVTTLTRTINKNLATIVAVADAQSQIIVKSANELSASGKAVLDSSGSLDGHSIACAGAAAKVAGDSAVTIGASAQGSVKVAEGCSSNAM